MPDTDNSIQIEDKFLLSALEQTLGEERRKNLLLTALVNQQQAAMEHQRQTIAMLSDSVADLRAAEDERKSVAAIAEFPKECDDEPVRDRPRPKGKFAG